MMLAVPKGAEEALAHLPKGIGEGIVAEGDAQASLLSSTARRPVQGQHLDHNNFGERATKRPISPGSQHTARLAPANACRQTHARTRARAYLHALVRLYALNITRANCMLYKC